MFVEAAYEEAAEAKEYLGIHLLSGNRTHRLLHNSAGLQFTANCDYRVTAQLAVTSSGLIETLCVSDGSAAEESAKM